MLYFTVCARTGTVLTEVRRQSVRVMAPGSELWLSHSAAITFAPRAILLPKFFFSSVSYVPFSWSCSFKFVSRSVSPKDLETHIIPANNSAKHGFSMQFPFSTQDLYPSILIKLGKIYTTGQILPYPPLAYEEKQKQWSGGIRPLTSVAATT